MLGTDIALFGGRGQKAQLSRTNRLTHLEFQGNHLHNAFGVKIVFGWLRGATVMTENLGDMGTQSIRAKYASESGLDETIPSVHVNSLV